MDKRTKLRRLRRLGDIVRAAKPETFDMSMWGEQTPCGTVLCAFGHAAMDKTFQKYGLKPRWLNSLFMPDTKCLEIRFKRYRENDAASAFFGISAEKAEWLFTDTEFVETKRQFLRRLSAVIEDVARGRP